MGTLKHSDTRQLTLPLEILKEDFSPEYAEIIKQSWKITFSRQHLTSVYAKRVMGLIASQIREDGEVKEYYQITAEKVINETGLQNREVYKRMKMVVYELAHIVYFLEDNNSKTIIPRHLLDTSRFKNPAGYYNGMLTVAFNPQLNGIVNQLAHYNKYELKEYMNFSSWYSMRLYELLTAFKDKNSVEFEILKYREWMGCGVKIGDKTGKPIIDKKTGKVKYLKYRNHSDAIIRTTREPLKDLKGTDLEFKVTPIKASAFGRGRPSIEKVRFDFVWQTKSNYEKIVSWIEIFPKFKKAYERLKAYKISDDIIAKYGRKIGLKKLNELLYTWDLRQEAHSKDRIINPEKYCNKVIADIGKKLESETFKN